MHTNMCYWFSGQECGIVLVWALECSCHVQHMCSDSDNDIHSSCDVHQHNCTCTCTPINIFISKTSSISE